MSPPAVDLSCLLAGVRLKSPLVLASGILGTHASLLERVGRSGAGAVTAKSCGPEPRRGHPNPTVVEWGHGLLNAVGLPNPGVAEELPMLRDAARRLQPLGVALIASIFADSPERFGEVARAVSAAGPDLIEVNVSCPNVASEYGEPFAASAEGVAAVTRAVCAATSIPVIVKLSPAVAGIARIASACERAGARAICAVNTMPGMLIDAESGVAVLANSEGGVSGPALKPIALRCVHAVCREVGIPVIGTGGVLTGLDAIEMIMAGATAVGVGSAFRYRGERAMELILAEMSSWLEEHGRSSLDEVRGSALTPARPVRPPSPPPVPGHEDDLRPRSAP